RHFLGDDPGHLLKLADVPHHHAVALRITQSLTQHSMGVANSARCQPVVAQGRVPCLDIKPGELLQHLVPKVRYDLMLGQLPIALRGPGRDFVCRFPLVDARQYKVPNRHLAWLDVRAGPRRGDQLGELALGALALAAHGDVAGLPFAAGRVDVELDAPRGFAATNDVASHFFSCSCLSVVLMTSMISCLNFCCSDARRATGPLLWGWGNWGRFCRLRASSRSSRR